MHRLTLAILSTTVIFGSTFVIERRADLAEARAEASHGPVGKLFDIDGIPVHALVTGSGPDVVLIHGASGNLRDFSFDLVDRLKDQYRVIAFDRPGLGWTGRSKPKDRRGESPQEQARFLQQAADRIGVRSPIVLGHSFGGAVALAWALERQDSTSALVLLGAVSHPWPGGIDALYHVNSSWLGSSMVVPLITAAAPERRVDRALVNIFAPQSVPDGYGRHVGSGLTLRRSSLRANAEQIAHLRPRIVEMSARYATLTLPIEILHGEDDTIVPLEVHSDPLSRTAPNANLIRMPGVGHMPHHAAPDEIVAAVHRAAARAGLRETR